tara:strand:+ start:11297 stop:13990 length:2694 start_codon:yes stop_codon:yes gene_type:complete
MAETALNVRLGAKTGEFNKKMMSASAKMKKFGKSVSNIGRSMSTMFTMPILLAGAASVKLSMEFQKSMTKIQTLVGKTGEEIETMKAGIMEMSTKTAKAPNELAEGLYFLESAGLRGANAMETLEQVAKGSASGLGEMEALSVVAAAAQNAYGQETLTASDALDKFGVMVRTGMFDAQELSNVLGKQLGLASNLGISFDEVGALISTYTSTTGDATSATNGLSAIMMTFAKLDTKPTANQAVALGKIKMTAGDVKEMLGEKGLMGTMTHLQGEFDKNGIAMGNFFASSQALKGALGVLGTQTEVYAANLDAMGNSAEFVGDAFAVTADTDAFKMEQAMNNLQVAGTQLGDSLAPVVQAISSKVMELTSWWTGLDKATQDNYASWAIWIATVGPALMLIGGIVSKAGMLIGVMKKFQVIQKVSTAAQWLWNAAMTANPIGVVVMAVAALVAAIIYFATSNSKVAIQVRNAFTEMANIVIGAINYLIKGINKFSKHLGFTIPKIKNWKKEALPAVKEVGDEVGNTADKVGELGKNLNALPASTSTKVNVDIVETTTKIGKVTVGDEEDPVEKNARLFKIEEKSLANISKLKNQFLVLNAKGEYNAAKIKLEQEKQTALDGVEATALGAEERENIEINFNKKLETLKNKQRQDVSKSIDAQKSDWEVMFESIENGWNKTMDLMNQFMSSWNAMQDAKAEREIVEMENKHIRENEDYDAWYARELAEIDQSGVNKELKEVKIAELDEKFATINTNLKEKQDDEVKGIQRKAAQREKKLNVFSAIINTAAAVVKALASAPPPANFVLAGIVAGLGAIEVGTIMSTPIPMASGGIAFGPTNALIGEYAGAKNNPEVVAPLDKLKSLLGDSGNEKSSVALRGELKGNNIYLSSQKTVVNRLRFI